MELNQIKHEFKRQARYKGPFNYNPGKAKRNINSAVAAGRPRGSKDIFPRKRRRTGKRGPYKITEQPKWADQRMLRRGVVPKIDATCRPNEVDDKLELLSQYYQQDPMDNTRGWNYSGLRTVVLPTGGKGTSMEVKDKVQVYQIAINGGSEVCAMASRHDEDGFFGSGLAKRPTAHTTTSARCYMQLRVPSGVFCESCRMDCRTAGVLRGGHIELACPIPFNWIPWQGMGYDGSLSEPHVAVVEENKEEWNELIPECSNCINGEVSGEAQAIEDDRDAFQQGDRIDDFWISPEDEYVFRQEENQFSSLLTEDMLNISIKL